MQAIYLLDLSIGDYHNPRPLTIHRFADIYRGKWARQKGIRSQKDKTTHMDFPSLPEFAHEYFTIVPGL